MGQPSYMPSVVIQRIAVIIVLRSRDHRLKH